MQEGELPFSDVLSGELVSSALATSGVAWKDRVDTPLVTLWVFLGQALSADHSCRAAVARLIAHRLSEGQDACSAKTGAYCQARTRLPEEFFSAVTRSVGAALDSRAHPVWLWKGRRVRELRVRIKQPGFRTKAIVLVTTLLDPKRYPKEDLAELYRARWNQELDLRSIKTTMQMDVLRCKTPELVRKEVWTHPLAYNLIRTVMAQAAAKHGTAPRTLSFKGAMQTLEAFQPQIDFQGHRGREFRSQLYGQLLDAVAMHRVANRPNRPDRFEPRRRKRRPPLYGYFLMPRNEAKLAMLKGAKTD